MTPAVAKPTTLNIGRNWYERLQALSCVASRPWNSYMVFTRGASVSAVESAATVAKKTGESDAWQSVQPAEPRDFVFGRTSWPMGQAYGAAAGCSADDTAVSDVLRYSLPPLMNTGSPAGSFFAARSVSTLRI
jgi:hypothetical protein